MDATISIDHLQGWERESKTIKFSSSVYSAIENIPNVLFMVVLYPFVLILAVPVLNFMLWRVLKSIRKEAPKFKTQVVNASYERAKEDYTALSALVMLVNLLVRVPEVSELNFFLRITVVGIYNKAVTISSLLSEMKDAAAHTLFVSVGKEELSEKERQALKSLNEVWGDDSDETYARYTHSHLTRKLKGDGV